MPINRRSLIKDLLILIPASHLKAPQILLDNGSRKNKDITDLINHHYSLYVDLITPREYPDDSRRHVQPPDWNTFGNKTNFITLRGFQIENSRVVNYSKDLDIYTKVYELGDIIWPNHNFLSAENISELIAEFKKRNLFLFDIWGYVPGSGPGTWTQFKLSPELSQFFSSQLGDHWLGMDNGEQDGRYIGGYASQMYPSSEGRPYQYLNFQQHFEKLTDDLGNKMSTLVSLNYGHYFLKQGLYTMIGAETAQSLPNTQIYYSFIRGAGKQYGVPWFGNSSVYNRWGYKTYDSEGPDHGPAKGTSLSLMRRLIYSHILYNAVAVGFEAGWFYTKDLKHFSGNKPEEKMLTPIGHIQRDAVQWIKKNGQPGVMHTPVALMLDFFAGWTFPRHLYSSDVYRVWGNLPYQAGDYWTDALLNMIYPGYQNSSYYHDESGFICATPYGDIADCLLSDSEGWILAQYPVLVLAGEISGGAEIHSKLQQYVSEGGHLIITSGNLVKFTEGLCDIKASLNDKHVETGERIQYGNKQIIEEAPFDFYPLSFPKHAAILASSGKDTLIVSVEKGKGHMTVLSAVFGISSVNIIPKDEQIQSEIDKPLPTPFPILNHVKAFLNDLFSSQQLFKVNEKLGLITCHKNKGEYLLGVTNNSWQEQSIDITSHCGDITSIDELTIDQPAEDAMGYLPESVSSEKIGHSAENIIAGGDIRIFSIKVQEQKVSIIPKQNPIPRPEERYLPLRTTLKIKDEILLRPTFFEHFNGVVLDWKYLHTKESDILKYESGWISRQKLKIMIDITSGVDFYPELRLIDNLHEDYENSMVTIKDVITKMKIFHATELILPLHRFPENSFTEQQTWSSFKNTFTLLCDYAKPLGINLNLRLCLGRPPFSIKEAIHFMEEVNANNLKLAPETAFLLERASKTGEDLSSIKDNAGLLLISGLKKDVGGNYWNQNVPIYKAANQDVILKIISAVPHIPLLLDGVYKNKDEEYLDAQILSKYKLKVED